MYESKFIRSTMWPKCFKLKPKYPSYSKPKPGYRQRYVQRQPNKSSYPAYYQAPRKFVLLQERYDTINDRLTLALEQQIQSQKYWYPNGVCRTRYSDRQNQTFKIGMRQLMNQSMPTKSKIRNRLKSWNPHRVLGGQSLEAGVFQECLIWRMLVVFATKFSDMW